MRTVRVIGAAAGLAGLACVLWWFLHGVTGFSNEPAAKRPSAQDATPDWPDAGVEGARDDPRLEGTGAPQPVLEAARAPAPHAQFAIRGTVLDLDGTPPTRAVVRLQREERVAVPDTGFGTEGIRHVEIGRRWTNGAGRFVFRDLAPGRYRLTALAPPGRLATMRDVDLVGADQEVELAWRTPVAVVIAVVDERGEPVVGAQASARLGMVLGACETDAYGLARLEGLDPEVPMTLFVDAPRGADLFDHRDAAWEAHDTRVVLERALRIAGRVVDETGVPVARARVLRRMGKGYRVHGADEDGAFVIPRLRAGTVTLGVAPPGALSFASTAFDAPWTVAAGTEDVALVLSRGVTLAIVVPDWPEDRRGRLRVHALSSDDLREVRIEENGEARVGGLLPDAEYAVWGTDAHSEQFVYHPGLRPRREPHVLWLQDGDPLHVVVEAPSDVDVRHVWVSGRAMVRSAQPLPEGTRWRVPPLPPGVWTVQAAGVKGSGPTERFAVPQRPTHLGSASGRPGDTVRVVLEAVARDE